MLMALTLKIFLDSFERTFNINNTGFYGFFLSRLMFWFIFIQAEEVYRIVEQEIGTFCFVPIFRSQILPHDTIGDGFGASLYMNFGNGNT